MREWKACATALLAFGCSTGPKEPACRIDSDRSLTCGPERVSLPITESRGLVVEGTLNGQGVHLLVDTGAERTVISSTLLGKPDQSGVLLDELCAGELCFRKEPGWAWDTPFSSADPTGINGFLGMNTLRNLVVGIDYGHHVILASDGAACSGKRFPMTRTDQGTPLVGVRAGNRAEETLTLDTGSLFTVLSSAAANGLTADLADLGPASLCTVNGCNEMSASTARIGTYCVFDRCANGVPVKFPVWDAVGFSYLSLFRIDLDFPTQTFVYCD